LTEEQKGIQKAAEEFAKGEFYKVDILTYYLKKEYEKSWQDVRKTECLGYPIHPRPRFRIQSHIFKCH
jgi:hypothetical protein